MFGMLRMAMTLLICILAIGFYLGWFTWTRPAPDPQSGKMNINVSVDENKVRSDLQKAEQNLAKRIQEISNQPQGAGSTPPAGQQPATPRLNFGPVSLQPSGQSAGSPYGPPAAPALSFGPFSLQVPSQTVAPPSASPASQQIPSQTQDYQFSVPLVAPPPGEGR